MCMYVCNMTCVCVCVCIYIYIGTCEYGNEPLGSVKCGEAADPVSFSRRTLLHGVSK